MQVKICGLKNIETLSAAVEAGADFVGLVFFPKSPRHVEPGEAAQLAEFVRANSNDRKINNGLNGQKIKIVALVVDASDEQLETIASLVQPDYFQLHGAETPQRAEEILNRYKIPLIKAIGVNSSADCRTANNYPMAEIILFDAKADPQISELPGGNGIPFDWTALSGQKELRNFMLSGGLNPDNVRSAISLTGASMVDVSSGVERARGVKDVELIKAFVARAKNLKE